MTIREPDPMELLTVDEVCAWFKVTRDWVYDEVEARRFPHVRLGRRHLRFRRDDLVAYMDAQRCDQQAIGEVKRAASCCARSEYWIRTIRPI